MKCRSNLWLCKARPVYCIAAVLSLIIHVAGAESGVSATAARQHVFGGGSRLIRVNFHNPGQELRDVPIGFQLYQATSTTLVPVGAAQAWTNVNIPANLDVIASIPVLLPEVRAETSFRIAWSDGPHKAGVTEVRVFPSDVLQSLAAISGETPIGLVDPGDFFQRAFVKIPIQKLKEAEEVAASECRLIIVAPTSPAQGIPGLSAAVKKRVAHGVGVLWFQPSSRRDLPGASPTCVVSEGTGRIVLASASMLENFSESPTAQLALIRLAEFAAGRGGIELPPDNPAVASAESKP